MDTLPELPEPLRYPQMRGNVYTAADMRAYAQAAVLAERRACIQVVNETDDQMHDERDFTLREAIVAAILARTD